ISSQWNTNGLGINASFDGTETVTFDYLYAKGNLLPAQPLRGTGVHSKMAWDWNTDNGRKQGRLYMVFDYLSKDDKNAGNWNTDVFVAYSDDGGQQFSTPQKVNQDTATPKSQFNSAIAVDQGTGYVAFTWYDATNDPNNTKVELYGTVSRNGRDKNA